MVGEVLVVLVGELEVALVDLSHVGVLLLRLHMAAVACVKISIQISLKE